MDGGRRLTDFGVAMEEEDVVRTLGVVGAFGGRLRATEDGVVGNVEMRGLTKEGVFAGSTNTAA